MPLDRPFVYVVTADALYGDERGIARREWLKDAIIEARGWAEIQTSLDLAIRRWLRSWQPEPVMPDVSDYPAEQADRVLEAHRERVRRHRDDLDGLSGDERAYVSERLVTLPMACTAAPIPVAIGLLAGMPLAGFADDLLAWCVADAIDWRSSGSRAAMQWLWRLAPDWGDLAQAVDRWTEDRLRTGASTAFRWAALGMLTAIGGFRQAGMAEAMWKSLSDEPRRTVLPSPWHVEGVDPLDPGIEDASVDTPALVIRYGELIRKEDWQPHLLMRPHSSFEEVLHLLCRFAPERAADLHREFAARAPTWDVSPTVAAAFLARDAIILAPAVDLLLSWYRQLVSQNLPAKELDAPTMLLAAILPHLRPARQFEVHGMQPSGAQDAFWLGPLTSPLPPSCLAAELANLSSAVEPARLRLALVFAAGTSAPIEALRPAACTARTSADPRLRAVGLRAMAISSDPADDADFLASGWAWSGSVGRAHVREDFWGSA